MSLTSKLSFGATVLACLGLAFAAEAAQKQKPIVLTGAAVIHDIRVMNGRYCFDGHVHYGASTGMPSLKAAQSEAINSWFQLVDLEYGGKWSDYRKSAAKDMKCAPSGAGWGCELHAIPCS
jgi:hypothetical protein